MNARSFFKNLYFAVISISVIIGLTAIFLVERIVPAIDEIVKENAYSVESSINMLDAISANDHHQKSNSLEDKFWSAFQDAEKNITLEQEAAILHSIKNLAVLYWSGSSTEQDREELSEKITSLAKLNLQDMKAKDSQAQFMGLTGAWAMGLLLLFSVGIQIYFRNNKWWISLYLVQSFNKAGYQWSIATHSTSQHSLFISLQASSCVWVLH